jgi:23S rRNA pseudouridine1911/1915/1917 synthase
MSADPHFSTKISFVIPPELADKRLDQVLAELLPDYSRSRLQQWLKDGFIRIDGEILKARVRVMGGENIEAHIPQEIAVTWQGQDMPLAILYEDDDLIVINKPAGQSVHPGAGTPDHTLVNALLHYEPRLAELPRGGIIHRLDKDTTGVLVVARRLSAYTRLVNELQERRFEREYRTVVTGAMISGGRIEAPLGRHPRQRTRMAVVVRGGKEAVTHYRVLQRFRAHTYLQVTLETGRTHQIRVHMAHINHPIVGDPAYGGRLKLPPQSSPAFIDMLRHFGRQALHAARLGLEHPTRGEFMAWEAPLPPDMHALLLSLEEDAKAQNAAERNFGV